MVLNTDLTEELIEEGLYRELLRRVQDLRKALDIEYTQRIGLSVEVPEKIRRILEDRREHFMEETLCTALETDGPPSREGERREMEINGELVTIVLFSV